MTLPASVTEADSEALPEWRLDDLYVGRDDPRLEADLEAARQGVADLVKLKGAFVTARADAGRLGAT